MKITNYKTNIKCANCVAKVAPYLSEAVGVDNWKVDIGNPEKTLTVTADVSADIINIALQKAGYSAKPA